MGSALSLWARGGYITAMFEYSPYPTDLARSYVLLFSSKQKHYQASSVLIGRLVVLMRAVTFNLGPTTYIARDSGIILSVDPFMKNEAAALKRRVGFDCSGHHVTELNRISLPRLENNLNLNLAFSSSSTNNNHYH